MKIKLVHWPWLSSWYASVAHIRYVFQVWTRVHDQNPLEEHDGNDANLAQPCKWESMVAEVLWQAVNADENEGRKYSDIWLTLASIFNRTKALVYFLGISVENSFKFYKLNAILLQMYLCFTPSVSGLYQIQGQNDFKLLYYKTWFFATLVSTLLSSVFTKVIWLLQQEVHLDHPWWRH